MAGGSLDFIVDSRGGGLVASFTSTKAATPPRFVAGDITPVSVRIVESTTDPDQPWVDVDLTGKTVKLSVGSQTNALTGGTFTATYGGDTTSALAYNISASSLSTALNALASITSAGGVTVTATGSAYRIAFVSNGTRTALTANVGSITPASEAIITTITAGAVSAKAVYVLRIKALPASSVLLDDDTAPTVTIATTQTGSTGTVSEIQTIDVDAEIYGGTYTLTIDTEETIPLDYDVAATGIQAALEALPSIGAGMVTVTGAHPSYVATFDNSLGNVDEMTVDGAALIGPIKKVGDLNNADIGFLDLLDGSNEATAKMEIEVIDDATSNKWTPAIVSCTILADV